MPKLVISYRRKDSGAISGRIFDRLVKDFGKNSVFMDIDSIPPAVDYRTYIDSVLQKADMLLVIIGNNWLGGAEKNRILIDLDPVRIELESAYVQKISLWPILIDDAQMPIPEQLPQTLKNFPYLNATCISSGRDFHSHMDRLVHDIGIQFALKRDNIWLKTRIFWYSVIAALTLPVFLFGG